MIIAGIYNIELSKKIFTYNKADIVLKTIGFNMPTDNPLNSPQTEYYSATNEQELKTILSSIKAETEDFDDTATFQ